MNQDAVRNSPMVENVFGGGFGRSTILQQSSSMMIGIGVQYYGLGGYHV